MLFLYARGGAAWVVLHIARFLKSLVNAVVSSLAAILTLFLVPPLRRRAAIHAGLFGWQLLGCPGSIGLLPPDLPPAPLHPLSAVSQAA